MVFRSSHDRKGVFSCSSHGSMVTVWPSVRLHLMRPKGLLTGHLDVSSVFLVDCFHFFEPLDFHFKGLNFLKEYMFADFLKK